ncbi:MAG TPA: hypothetical protein VGF94_04375 [Kofleriaceae bacterium]|jgi:hypothetical protein
MTARVYAACLVALCACRDRGPQSKEQRAGDAIARVTKIEQDLVHVRELEFRDPVPAAYQTTADFRAFVHGAVDKNRAKVAAHAEALERLGLLVDGGDRALLQSVVDGTTFE